MLQRSWPLPMDLYRNTPSDAFNTSVTRWWTLPKSDHTSIGPVISVSAKYSNYWIVGYTILITLTFGAFSELALGLVLAFYPERDSGNLHAILVSYYNAEGPAVAMKLMVGYIKRSLLNCKRNEERAIDKNGLMASVTLFLLSLSIVASTRVTEFIVPSNDLSISETGAAPANPDKMYYPNYIDDRFTIQQTGDGFQTIKAFLSPAINQALARQLMAKAELRKRVRYNFNISRGGGQVRLLGPSGNELPNATVQEIGSNAIFTYGYTITGYDMGLIEGAGLQYTVNGSCSTYYGRDYYYPYGNPTAQEDLDVYPIWGYRKILEYIPISRERYSPPWAHGYEKSELDGVSINQFQITPHTGWHFSRTENLGDPWYETEPAPGSNGILNDRWNSTHRVKRGRPPLRCIQNDTWSYRGRSVNDVAKLSLLPGLKLSPFLRDSLLRLEFRRSILVRILNNIEIGLLESTIQFSAETRQLSAGRCNISDDFERLLHTAYVYSRDIVRNTVLLFPSTRASYDYQNLANRSVLHPWKDIWVETNEAVVLSAHTLIVTPIFCAFMWLCVFASRYLLNPHSGVDNKDNPKSRHNRRFLALQAVQLYRFLDEAVSGGARKFSGRNSQYPYIKDLSLDYVKATDQENASPLISEKVQPSINVSPASSQNQAATEVPGRNEQSPSESAGQSQYVDPRITIVDNAETIRNPDMASYELSMTRKWNKNIEKISWHHLRDDK